MLRNCPIHISSIRASPQVPQVRDNICLLCTVITTMEYPPERGLANSDWQMRLLLRSLDLKSCLFCCRLL